MARHTIVYTRIDPCATQQAVQDAWNRLTAERGAMPTAKEIVVELGGTVKVQTIYSHLHTLSRQGLIDRPKQRSGHSSKEQRQRQAAVDALEHLRRPTTGGYVIAIGELARHLEIEVPAARKWMHRLAKMGKVRSAEPIGHTGNWLVEFNEKEGEVK